jgi:hypothetical protein
MPHHAAHSLPFSQQQKEAFADCLKGIKQLMKRYRGGQPRLRCFISYAWYSPATGEMNLQLQAWLRQLRRFATHRDYGAIGCYPSWRTY